MKAVILAAGKGTRMQGLCDDWPKPLLPVGGIPILEWLLHRLHAAGIQQTLIVIGHEASRVRAALGTGFHAKMDIQYVVQDPPEGTGQAALLARNFVGGEPFLLAFGDILSAGDTYERVRRQFERRSYDMLLTVHGVKDPCTGAAVYVEDGLVRKIVEKPPPGTSTTNFDNAGIFVFRESVFSHLVQVKPSPRGEYELTDAIHQTVADGGRVAACPILGFWRNVTDPAAYLQANRFILRELKRAGAETIDPSAEVAREALFDPLTSVSARARVGAALIRHNTSVSTEAVVDDRAQLEHTIILPGGKVGAGAFLKNVVVGVGAEIPAGARVVGTRTEPAVVLQNR